jgi:hypothetical protein
MAWNGSGTFARVHNWVTDKLASVKITASRMDAEFDNYKTGLEACLTRNGETTPSANTPWNSKKITGLANGTASTDAANYGQITGLTTGNAFRRNMLINGGFDVWQAGAGGSASIAGAATRTRTADCWWAIRAGTTGYTVSQQTGEANRYALKWQRDNGNASTEAMYLAQSLETADVVWLKRGTPPTVTVSFRAKTGANYSGGDLTTALIRGTGTDENVLDTYTGATTLGSLVQTLTGTLTRYSFSAAADASTNELGIRFTWTPTGSAGANDSITLEDVQVEVASAATDFERLPFGDTLRMCQRYYEKTFAYGTAPAQNAGAGTAPYQYGITTDGLRLPAPVARRVGGAWTGTTYNPSAANAQAKVVGGADATGTAISATESMTIVTTATAGTGTWMVHYIVADDNF